MVDSKEGRGTTFTVTLPFKVEQGTVAPEVLEAPELVLPDVLMGLKILLVEDNAMNREIAVTVLQSWACRWKPRWTAGMRWKNLCGRCLEPSSASLRISRCLS